MAASDALRQAATAASHTAGADEIRIENGRLTIREVSSPVSMPQQHAADNASGRSTIKSKGTPSGHRR